MLSRWTPGKRTLGGENKGRKRLDESLQPVVQRGWSEGFRYTGTLMRLERWGLRLWGALSSTL